MRLPPNRFGRALEVAAVAAIVALAGVTATAGPAGRAGTVAGAGAANPSAAAAPNATTVTTPQANDRPRAVAAAPVGTAGGGPAPAPTVAGQPTPTGSRTVTPVRPTGGAGAGPRTATATAPTTAAPGPAPATVAPTTATPNSAPPATAAPTTAAPTTAAPTTTAPTTTPPPSGTTASVPLGTGARLLFDDEFNGPLNTAVWETCWWYTDPSATGCPHDNGEMQWYLKSDPTTSNGSLVLTANRQTVSGITPSGQPTTYNYTSGEVDTHGKFSFQYGYVEWRAQVPAGQGLWPALWLLPADGSWPPEIDALEVLGNDPATAYFTNYPPSGNSCTHALHGADLSAAPHVFGVNWQPTGITWYVDGAAVARCTTADGGISAKPMYLVMNLAVGGSWPGAPNASTPFPARMTIDWVRVWQ